ncbi:trigger factor [Leptospira perolatii]|uniref:Trigger factor n=1 Tax=Leptospira perolatii TaxID=2023191 RepID=A0A2M9ZMP5_9LEPT|nr:trigger factor [Leptospira perolatii]PJZ70071.1 trigger factor [Leptospira perolatii]PJZ73259.1 trigger factor [Leptospira perolatii]
MEFKTKKNQNASVDIKLTFDQSDLDKAFDKAYLQKQKELKIPGFRPGKAPLPMVKRHLGDSVASDAIQILLVDSMNSISGNLEHKMVRFPKFEIQDYQPGKTLIATAVYDTEPEVSLGKYKKIKIKLPEVQVVDDDLQDEIEQIRKQLARKLLREPEEGAVAGDIVDMEFLVKEEGQEPKSAKNGSSDYKLGESNNLPGFDDHLYGLKVGEEKTFAYTYPADYPREDLAGKTLEFDMSLKAIYKQVLPEVDDDLANEFDGSETLSSLKDKLRENLKKNYSDAVKNKKMEEIYKELVTDSKFIFPESYLNEESEHVFQNMIQELRLPSITMEQYAEMAKKSLEEVKSSFRTIAENRLKGYFARQKLAAQEGIILSDEEFDREITSLASRYGMSEADFRKELEKGKLLANYRDTFLSKKIDDTLFELVEKKYNEKMSIRQLKEFLSNKESGGV